MPAKKPAKARAPLAGIDGSVQVAPAGGAGGKAAGGKGGKSIEQIYQKKTQLEHILLRPDSYSTCRLDLDSWPRHCQNGGAPALTGDRER
jgi:hypothetical protein